MNALLPRDFRRPNFRPEPVGIHPLLYVLGAIIALATVIR
jgi:hypothetical protein